MNRQIAISALSIVMALGLTVGGTLAYFTDTATSTGNTFSTGTLEINLLDQNADTVYESETVIDDWAPGETALVNFDVENDGTLPINLRGFATGTWGDGGLDSQDVVKVTQVERWNGSSWELLGGPFPGGLTGYFHYSPDGTDASLFEVAPGSRAQLQLTVVLDESAGNGFQNQTFTSSIQVEAKQVDAPWE